MKHFKNGTRALLTGLTLAASISAWAQSSTTTYAYDPAGRLSSVVTPGGRSRSFQWDALGRNTVQTNSGATVGLGYNGQDRLTAVQDPKNLTTTYGRNGFGEAQSQVSPDTGSTNLSFDSNGNLTSRVNAAGQTESYTYDAADRVVTETLTHPTAGSITYTFAYATSGPSAGKAVQVTAPGLTLGFAHNLFGQVTTAAQSVAGSPLLSVSYGYASNGAMTSITYPSGRVVTFTLDAASRVSAITAGSSTVLTGVSYNALGAVGGWTFGNGQGVSRTFDLNGRVASVTMPFGIRIYGYDVDDRIVSIADAVLGTSTYGYDNQDRLTSASTAIGNWAYPYDANGNRTAVTINGATFPVIVDGASNRHFTVAAPYLRETQYAANGQPSQVSGGSPSTGCGSNVSLGYTADGQLVTSNVLSAVNAPSGQRLQKTAASCAGGGTVNFVYDQAGHLIGEYDAAGAVIQETVWLGDLPVAVFKAAGGVAPYFAFADNLGTPRAITNGAAQLVWQWDGEPFGATPASSNPLGLGQFVYNLRFPGQYFDSETGYHHNGWREYDPALGRYVQSDPIGLQGGLNTYLYASASPLMRTDAKGLADINKFSPFKDWRLYRQARDIDMGGSFFTYAAHMNNELAADQSLFRDKALRASEIAREIASHPNFKHQPIMMLGCQSGQFNPQAPTLAQGVANILRVPVQGYPDYAWFQDDGVLPYSRDADRLPDGSWHQRGPKTKPIWFLPQ